MNEEETLYRKYDRLTSFLHYDPFNEIFSRDDFEHLSNEEQRLLVYLTQKCANLIIRETPIYEE